MGISDYSIARVKEAIDILDVVNDFVSLKKVGQSYRGLSPFNQEKTPSFYVSPGKGIFKDFSSGKGGDAIHFLMELEGYSYMDAIKFLAQKYGIEIEEVKDDEAIKAETEREAMFIVLNFANQFFIDQLQNSEEGKNIGQSYFKERGITDEAVKKFQLGYTADKWNGLLTAAKKAGHSEEMLEKAGLILKNEKTGNFYDRFRGRVTFPIHSVTGKPIAFGARILISNKNQPKYINSPETTIYHKSNVLYGIHLARQPIRQKDKCYLVEGYTDVIALHMAGIENVVASSGTSLTEGQIAIIKRYTNNVTVLYDGDAAGIKASLRGIDLTLELGLTVRIVLLPEGEDPDSFALSKGSEETARYLEQKEQDFLSFKSGLLLEQAGKDPIKRSDALKEVIQTISLVPDQIQRSVYVREIARIFDFQEEVIIAELNKILLQKRTKKKNVTLEDAPELTIELSSGKAPQGAVSPQEAVFLQEKECISILINYGDQEMEENYHLYDMLRDELNEIDIQHPVYSKIFNQFYLEIQQGRVPSFEYFLDYFHDDLEVQQILVDLATEKYDVSERWMERWKIHVPKEIDPVRNILRIKFRNIRRMIEYNQEDLKEAEELGTIDKVEALIKAHQHLKKLEMQVAQALGNVIA